jgi:hypothetical protein
MPFNRALEQVEETGAMRLQNIAPFFMSGMENTGTLIDFLKKLIYIID